MRRRLGAAAFQASWTQGRAEGLDDAIDAAVNAIERLQADTPVAALQKLVPILTPREMSVLELLSRGQTNREIATALYVSTSTAGVHVSNILRKLRAKRRTDAAMRAQSLGLIEA